MNNTWRFTGNEFKYIKEVLDSGEGSGTSGNMNGRFEKAFANKVGAEKAITFNSGTGTLHAALYAAGVRAGDEVITTPLTVISNLDVILACNAIPVFADIDPGTFNIDPDDIAIKITNKTKAIMPVSLYGLSCDLDPIMKMAKQQGIIVVNDAAQAHMATYKGRPIAEIADITSYSLENSKHITTGDGGIVVTNDEQLALEMRKFGSLGYAALKSKDGRVRLNKDIFQDPDYKRHDDFGFNYRMPEVAAAIGLAQVERIEQFINNHKEVAKLYSEVVREASYLVPQKTPHGYGHTYWTYSLKYINDDIPWQMFRKKYIDFGGDGIYAAWALLYEETLVSSGRFREICPSVYDGINFPRGICPHAEKVQSQIMQFVNNYGSVEEAGPKIDALVKTINYFDG